MLMSVFWMLLLAFAVGLAARYVADRLEGRRPFGIGFHWQDLNEVNPNTGRRPRLLEGRCWFRFRDRRKRFDQLRLCWTVPPSHFGWDISFGGEDREIQVTLCIPWVATLWVTLDNALPDGFIPYVPYKSEDPSRGIYSTVDSGDDREIGVYFHDGAIWWHFWVGTMASWSSDYPWCKWWRQGSFHFADILGKRRCTTVVLRDGIQVTIPMPEGSYHGVAKQEKRTWKRALWFPRSRYSTWIDVDRGIPHAGKGENSWDCGDDAVCGCGVDGLDLDKAVAHFVESVLKNRRRYGTASDKAVEEALAAAK